MIYSTLQNICAIKKLTAIIVKTFHEFQSFVFSKYEILLDQTLNVNQTKSILTEMSFPKNCK